ncbi:5243_t:CDS:10 [Paraglomus brasilianum]|uniref:glutamate--tRNA ligase n=1 Tax=Paraglomus brasilianum TaxID=144538 RepID=A0A9N9G4B2_9GLOM|nr:5243_t:CDS:10 [Paraglomus brasilianum]
MTLEKIRKVLSQCENGENGENGESIMKFDMYFCNKGCPNEIRRSEEATIYLREILGDNNSLCIKLSEKHEEVIPRLIKEKKLNCGIRWTENGPKQSDNIAFKFNRHEFGTHRPEYRCKFEKSNKKLCDNGIEWKLDLNMSWLPFTGSIGAHLAQKGSEGVEHKSCRILERYSRKTLLMKREHIAPSDEFRNEVKQALELGSQKKRRDALNEVCEKYGHFWARTVQLGGLIIKDEEEHKETTVQSAGGTIGIDATLGTAPMEINGGISRNNETLNQNSSSNSDKNITVVGGDETAYKREDDIERWIETLEDCFTWKVVDYEDIVPIFELFEETTRNDIIKAFGPRICYHGINELKLLKKTYPCVRPLKINSDVWEGIRQHQIFAEVMCDGKSDAIFAVNIEQKAIGPPNIHVSKVRGSKSFFKLFRKSCYKLKIAYIITGYPQSFISQTVDELSVEVDVVDGEKRDDKIVASLPRNPDFNQSVVLMTCYVTQQPTGAGDYMIFAMHLHKDGTNNIEVCISAYGRSNNGSYQIEELPQENIKIAYCEKGLAYVDETDVETIRYQRMHGIPSANRDRSIEENLRLYKEMTDATEFGQTCCLRAKIDMNNPNKALRDLVLYRCNLDKWKVYLTYDFVCPIVDSVEGVTHAMRTNEYHDRNPQYEWILNLLELRKVHIRDFSVNYNSLDEGLVTGWDDPRFPLFVAFVYVFTQGATQNDVTLEWDKLWALNKKVIDPIAPRHTSILTENIVRAKITGGPAESYIKDMPKHKKNPDVGTKKTTYSSEIFIEQGDAKTFGLEEEITLMDWGNAIVKSITKSEDNPEIVSTIELQLHLEGDFRKTKKKITWLADTEHVAKVKLVDYDYLINKKKLAENDDVKDFLTAKTEFLDEAIADGNVRDLKKGDIIQFERRGYYIFDSDASSDDIRFIRIPDGKASNVASKANNCCIICSEPNTSNVFFNVYPQCK